jgi:predicted dienelactone hydrolase
MRLWTLGLMACGRVAEVPVEPVDPVAWALDPGPYQAGYRESEVVYDPGDGSGERALRLAIWYPTGDQTGGEVRYLGVFEAPDVLDAPTPAALDALPLAVFSHGHQGFAESFGVVCSHLARRGWVVVAPDHTGNTTFDNPTRLTPIYAHRQQDISATLDHVMGGGEPWLPSVASEALGIGHSFGGYTMLALAGAAYDVDRWEQACPVSGDDDGFCSTWGPDDPARFRAGFRDPRITAVVLAASGDFGLFGAAGVAQVEVPVLNLTGGLDAGKVEENEWIWDALPDEAWRAHNTRGGHLACADFAGTAVEVDEGVMDGSRSLRICKAYTMGFAGDQFGNFGPGVLDPSVTVDDAVELSYRGADR